MLRELLAHPVIAASLGLLLGMGMALVSRLASKFMTPDDPTRGFAKVIAATLSRSLVTLGLMMLYFAVAPGGFLVFSMTLVLAFISSLAYEAFRASCPLSSRQLG